MSAEENKALVQRFCALISARDAEALFDLIAEDGSWSVPYRSDRFQFGGFKDKQAAKAMVPGFLSAFSEFSFKITGITAEGDRVAVEAESKGVGPGKATYQNNYNMTFICKGGKIHTIREYFDPFQVLAYIEQLQ